MANNTTHYINYLPGGAARKLAIDQAAELAALKQQKAADDQRNQTIIAGLKTEVKDSHELNTALTAFASNVAPTLVETDNKVKMLDNKLKMMVRGTRRVKPGQARRKHINKTRGCRLHYHNTLNKKKKLNTNYELEQEAIETEALTLYKKSGGKKGVLSP